MLRQLFINLIFGSSLLYTSGLSSVDFGFALEGFPVTKRQLDQLKYETKMDPKIIEFYLQWPADPKQPPLLLSSLEAIGSIGAIPCVTWEPMYYKDKKRVAIHSEEIIKGVYDNYINAFAKDIGAYGGRVIVRFAHEMNLKEYHWGSDEAAFGSESPEKYKAMFRYIAAKLKKMQPDHVLMAFCPNADSVPDEGWNTIANFFPGEAYVDLFGIDGYNWGTPSRSFKEIFNSAYEQLKAINKTIPIMIFETSTVDQGQLRQNWIKEAISTSKEWGIKAIIWFHVKKEHDWQLRHTDIVQ